MNLGVAVGKRINQLIKEKNITQYQLFKLTGVPQSTLSTISSGLVGTVKLSTIFSICDGLGISLKQFFDSPLFDKGALED